MTITKFEVPDWIRSVLICDPTDIWGNVVGMGLSELAAVLSPAKRFDRRGNVIFLDDFENGLSHCQSTVSGTGGAITLTTANTRVGGFAANLVGGSTSLRLAELRYLLPKPPLSKVGIEAHFRMGDNVEYVYLTMWLYDGTKCHKGEIRYDQANYKWQYLKADATYVDFQTGAVLQGLSNLFHGVKLVVDLVNDVYVRALVTGQEEDLSTIPIRVTDDYSNPDIELRFMITSLSGTNGWCYVDSVIVTQNEPA